MLCSLFAKNGLSDEAVMSLQSFIICQDERKMCIFGFSLNLLYIDRCFNYLFIFDHQGPGGIRGPRGEKVNTSFSNVSVSSYELHP